MIKNTKVYADMIVKSTGQKVSFHIDSGSSVNILPIKYKLKGCGSGSNKYYTEIMDWQQTKSCGHIQNDYH